MPPPTPSLAGSYSISKANVLNKRSVCQSLIRPTRCVAGSAGRTSARRPGRRALRTSRSGRRRTASRTAGRTASGRAPACRRAGRARGRRPRRARRPRPPRARARAAFGRRGERVANVPRGSSSRNAGTVSSQPVVSWRCASTQTCEKPATSRRLPRCGSVISIREGPASSAIGCRGMPVQRAVRGADAADRRVDDRLRDPPVAERLDERERRPRGRETPEREGRLEPLRGRRARLELPLRPGRGARPGSRARAPGRGPTGRAGAASPSARSGARGRGRPERRATPRRHGGRPRSG